MRTVHTEAIVLDVRDLQEADRIVTLLTEERGKKRGVARGAKRKYSRFSGRLQPLAKVQVSWFEKEGRDLVRFSDIELIRPLKGLQDDLDDILLGAIIAEHFSEFVQEDEPDDRLFRLLDSTLEAVSNGVDLELATRWIEVWILRLAGIFPAPRECPICQRRFDQMADDQAVLPVSGEAIVCTECAGDDPGAMIVGPAVLDHLLALNRRPLEEFAAEGPDKTVLARTANLAGRVRRGFLGKELRSYRVLASTRQRIESDSASEPDPDAHRIDPNA